MVNCSLRTNVRVSAKGNLVGCLQAAVPDALTQPAAHIPLPSVISGEGCRFGRKPLQEVRQVQRTQLILRLGSSRSLGVSTGMLLRAPIHTAVSGMICIRPTAPLR